MTQAERIIKSYDVAFIKPGFLAIRKKGDKRFITIAPSKTVNLYFLFGGRMDNFEELKRIKKHLKSQVMDFIEKCLGKLNSKNF